MSVELKREVIKTYRLVNAAEQTVGVEGEAVLPGGLRDEVRVFYTAAKAIPLVAEAVGNRVTVSGKVDFEALYAQGDLTHVRAAETSSDFSRQLTLSQGDTAAQFEPQCEVMNVSARVFNGRLLMHADVSVSARGVEEQEISAVTAVAQDGAQVLTEQASMQRSVGGGAAQGLIKGEFDLSEALKAEETLLGCGEARVEDIVGGADGRATVIGTIDLTVCHASDLPGRPLVYTQHALPFEQGVTLSGEMGDMLSADVQVTDVAAAIENGEKGQTLRVEAGIRARIEALREEKRDLVSDVFSSSGKMLTPSGARAALRTAVINEQTAESGRLQLMLPEGTPRIKTVLAAFVQPILAGAKRENGKLQADMQLRATLVYMTEDSGIPVAYTAEEPVRMAFAGDMTQDDQLTVSASRVEASAVAGDRAEIRYVIILHADGARYHHTFAVTDVVEEEKTAAQPVLAVYCTQGDERVWDVMKRYGLSLEGLRALNDELKDADKAALLPAGARLIAYKRS